MEMQQIKNERGAASPVRENEISVSLAVIREGVALAMAADARYGKGGQDNRRGMVSGHPAPLLDALAEAELRRIMASYSAWISGDMTDGEMFFRLHKGVSPALAEVLRMKIVERAVLGVVVRVSVLDGRMDLDQRNILCSDSDARLRGLMMLVERESNVYS